MEKLFWIIFFIPVAMLLLALKNSYKQKQIANNRENELGISDANANELLKSLKEEAPETLIKPEPSNFVGGNVDFYREAICRYKKFGHWATPDPERQDLVDLFNKYNNEIYTTEQKEKLKLNEIEPNINCDDV